MSVGEVIDPNELGKGRSLFYLKEQLGGDEEDLKPFRELIQKELWKEQEDRLTGELLERLRIKYQVEIDDDRIAALDIGAPDDSFSDDPVITTNQENVSEKQFMAVIRKLMETRPPFAHAAVDKELASELKSETAFNIVNQSVTNWESLDRHYEEKEPFKWEYEFNYNHRLVINLGRLLFEPKTTVTDEEVKQHYEENITRYSQPAVVKLYIIDETQGPIDKIWVEVATGKYFPEVLKQQFEQPVQPNEVPVNHLDPEVKAVVVNLVDGETSQIFTAQGIRVMVHVVERTPESPVPLERVQQSIRSQLSNEKYEKVRSDYLEKLKSNSEIEIKMRKWKEIQKELGGA